MHKFLCSSATLLAFVGFGTFSAPVLADDAPPAYKANPEVYKVLAENSQFRVLLASWKPGFHDVPHSHPAAVIYRLSDCKSRVYGADGKLQREGESKAGTVVISEPVPSHSFENIGTTDCQTLLVERKQ